MKKVFQWAFIGSGRIANTVAKEILETGRHKIYSVYSRNKETAKKFAGTYGARYCETLKEAVENKEVDAVYIAVPQNVHCEFAEAVWKIVNKPVIVEKPFAVNTNEFTRMKRLAEHKNVYLNEAMCMLINPVTEEIKEKCKELGNIKSVDIKYAMGTAKLVNLPRLLENKSAGGALLEIGVYGLTFCRALFGMPLEIRCCDTEYVNGVDLGEKVILQYNGFQCNLFHSLKKFRGVPRAVICGTKGMVVLPFFSAPWFAFGMINGHFFLRNIKRKRYIYEFDHFAQQIRDGKMQSDIAGLNITGDTIALMDACRKQMKIKYANDESEIHRPEKGCKKGELCEKYSS